MKKKVAVFVLSIAPLAAAAQTTSKFPEPAELGQPDTWSVGVGLEFSSGDYGTPTDTDILTLPFQLRYDRGPWLLKFELPFYHLDGARSVIPGFGAIGSRRTDSSATGIGDLTAGITHHTFADSANQFNIDLTGKVKAPIGDEDEGLSTGSTDVTLQADAYKGFGRITAFGGLGFTAMFGGMANLKNTINYSLGASHRLDQGDTLALYIDGRTAPADNAAAQRELVASWSRPLSKLTSVKAYGLFGLANGSPDWGIGASLLRAF